MKNLKSRDQLFEAAYGPMVTYSCGPRADMEQEFVDNYVGTQEWVEKKLETFAKTRNPKPEYKVVAQRGNTWLIATNDKHLLEVVLEQMGFKIDRVAKENELD